MRTFWVISIALLLGVFATDAPGQQRASTKSILARLDSPSVKTRTLAARDVFGAGIEDEEVYEKIADLVEEALPDLGKGSPRIDEISWHLKALASSGDAQYRPLLEKAATSDVSKIRRYANIAMEVLQQSESQGTPLLRKNRIPLITEDQSDECEYIAQESCRTTRSSQKCIAWHQKKAARAGANAILLLHTSSRTVSAGFFGGDTSMIANYYLCPRL